MVLYLYTINSCFTRWDKSFQILELLFLQSILSQIVRKFDIFLRQYMLNIASLFPFEVMSLRFPFYDLYNTIQGHLSLAGRKPRISPTISYFPKLIILYTKWKKSGQCTIISSCCIIFTTWIQCWKFSEKSCRCSSLESQIINIKLTKSSWSSSKVVGLGLADLWVFPTLHGYAKSLPQWDH